MLIFIITFVVCSRIGLQLFKVLYIKNSYINKTVGLVKVLINNDNNSHLMNHTLAKWLNNKLVLLIVSILFGFAFGTIINMILWFVNIDLYYGLIGVVIMAGYFFFVVGEKAELQIKGSKQ